MNYTDGIYRWGKKEVERVRNNTSVHLITHISESKFFLSRFFIM